MVKLSKSKGLFLSVLHFLLLSFYIFMIAPLGMVNSPDLGIDGSWMLALPLAVEKGMTFGTDFLFTYGPLGYLVTRVPLNLSSIPYLLFDIYFLLNIAYSLNYILKRNSSITAYLVTYISCILFGYIYNANIVIPLSWILLFMLFHFIIHKKKFILINSIVLTIMLFFIKANVGIVVLFFFYSCLAFCVHTKKIGWREALIYTAIHLTLTFLASIILNVDIFNYIIGSLHLINGYNDAMFLKLQNPYVLYSALLIVIALIGISLTYIRTIMRDFTTLYILLIVSAMLYITFKQGFVRADGHYLIFFTFSSTFISLAAVFSSNYDLKKSLSKLVIFALFIGYVLIKGEVNSLFYFPGIEPKAAHLKSYASQVINKDFKYEYKFLKREREIPEPILKQIGSASIDIIPWEISYIILNDLNYNPRPVIQTYSAYDEYLDHLNYQKYSSEDAPEYILYQLTSMDLRYAFFDETQTKLAILANYEVVDRSWEHLLLKKLPKKASIKTISSTKGTAKLDEYILVDQLSDIQYLKPSIEYSFLGKLQRFLFQPPQLYVTFMLNSGITKTYRTITTIVNGGVIVNKYVEDNAQMDLFISHNGKSTFKAKGVKFHTDEPWGFKEEYSYSSEIISIHSNPKKQIEYVKLAEAKLPAETNNIFGDLTSVFDNNENYLSMGGWAAIEGMGSENTQISVVLQSQQHTYLCQTLQVLRPDVTAQVKTFNYDHSGFHTFVPKKDIRPGTYRVGIQIIKNDTVKALQFTDKVINKNYNYIDPNPIAKLPAETNNIFGDLTSVFDNNENYLSMGGWAAIEGMGSENTQISVVLQSQQHTYLCQTLQALRPDVTAQVKTFNYDHSGFYTFISKNTIAPGTYRVGIQIIKNDTVKALQFTDKAFKK